MSLLSLLNRLTKAIIYPICNLVISIYISPEKVYNNIEICPWCQSRKRKECFKHSFSISGTLCTIYTGILYTELVPIAKYGS